MGSNMKNDKRKFKPTPAVLGLGISLWMGAACAQTFQFEFGAGTENWEGDFADYPVGQDSAFQLAFQRRRLPAPLDTTRFGLMMKGNNHSDDLFMFIRRRIEGLEPGAAYKVAFDIRFASHAPTGAIGIGGAPGESVVMKAGATLIKPVALRPQILPWPPPSVLMNIDKGNQSQPGKDMDTIGHVGVSDTTKAFALVSRDNRTHPFAITADSNGSVWVIIGTDSGFEGMTTLYYHRIAIDFRRVGTGTAPGSPFGSRPSGPAGSRRYFAGADAGVPPGISGLFNAQGQVRGGKPAAGIYLGDAAR
jgi:hypothetical protein